jgi:hydroxymethylpyrimidine pyrophosphatase-like HAD family hydrolase
LLVRAGGTSKGTGLAALCDYHRIALADAVVVGDWLNDIPMFNVAGRSFAMGGAIPQVAAAATDQLQAPHGQGGGIAELVNRVWR